jgi:zinc protease
VTLDALDRRDLAPPARTGVQRTTIDGIPVFWADVPGPFTAGMIFGVGMADEAPADRGVTHLVEHLALPTGPVQGVEFNGTVSPVSTWFWAAGDRDAALGLIRDTAAALQHLPDRVGTEREILLTEAAGRGKWTGSIATALRFGPTPYGLSAYPEWGLRWLTVEAARQWAGEAFNGDNAAVWMTGPPPDALDLPLPAGDRRVPVEPKAIEDVRFPTYAPHGAQGGVTLAMMFDRSWAAALVGSIATTRLRAKLRYELALSYSVDLNWEPLTQDVAHVVFACDCRQGNERQAAEELLRVLEQLAETGPTQAELERELDERRRHAADGSALPGLLYAAAANEVLGKPFEPTDVGLARAAAVDAEAARAALERALPTALLLTVDAGWKLDEPWSPYPMYSDDTVEGEAHKLAAKPKSDVRLVVGDEGVSRIDAKGNAVTVRWENCELVERWPDGRRVLFGRDATRLLVDRSDWKDGTRAVAAIDAELDDRSIPMNELLEAEASELRARIAGQSCWNEAMQLNLTVAIRHVEYGEHLLDALVVKVGMTRAVLVLTSRRLLLVAGGTPRLEIMLDKVDAFRHQGLRWPNDTKLLVQTEEQAHVFEEAKPRSHLAGFLERLDAALEGRGSADAVEPLSYASGWAGYGSVIATFLSVLLFWGPAFVGTETPARAAVTAVLTGVLCVGTTYGGWRLARRGKQEAARGANGGGAAMVGWWLNLGFMVIWGLCVIGALLSI